ncbi:MAG: DUF1840 domain-containing protein [Burkholderiaceae bacterium]
MLYKFRSQATGDVIMLAAHGQRALEIIGKVPGAPGIVLVSQIPAALAALEAALALDAAPQDTAAGGKAAAETAQSQEAIGLRQRLHPLQDMLRRSAQEGKDVVWSV